MFLIVVAFLFITFYLWYQVKYQRRNSLLAKIPTPEGLPIIRHSHRLYGLNPQQIFNFAEQISYECGPLFVFTLNPFDDGTVMVADPIIAEAVLKSQKLLEKGLNYNPIRRWLGDGLLLSTGEKWHQRRKILTPTFHFQILERFVEIMNNQGEVLIEKLAKHDQKVIDIFPLVNLYTLDVICESAMGCKMNAQNASESEYVKAVQQIGEIIFKRYFDPFLRYDFFYQFSNMCKDEKKCLRILHGFTDEVIRARKEELRSSQSSGKNDENYGAKKRMALLDLLLQSEIDGKPLSDTDIREEVDTFMFEGHDTTTSGISFCLYNIAKHPEVQQKIFEELQANHSESAKIKELNDLRYLELVIKESLRLYPPVPFYGRKPHEEVTANGYTIPKNCNLQICAYLMGRDEKIFPNPLEFKPERFDVELTAEKLNPFAYVPFSAGPRNCIGQKFAMYEMKSTISKIVKNFELSLPENSEELEIYMELVLKSNNGVKLMIKKRK